jgi:hypothetical protein
MAGVRGRQPPQAKGAPATGPWWGYGGASPRPQPTVEVASLLQTGPLVCGPAVLHATGSAGVAYVPGSPSLL